MSRATARRAEQQPEPVSDEQRLTQGPYKGRTVAELSDAELERAQETCPYEPASPWHTGPEAHLEFKSAWKMLDKELGQRKERAKQSAREARASSEAGKAQAQAKRAAREAAQAAHEAWKASMTAAEQATYGQVNVERRRLIELAVKGRLEAAAKLAAKRERARERRANQKRQEEEDRIEAERRRLFFEAHPTADEWDYQAEDVAESEAEDEAEQQEHTTALEREIIEAGTKALARKLHPDIPGGSHEQFVELKRVSEALLERHA